MKKNILVFPCGSEVALEVHRSLRYSTHFDLIGASSVDDHGKFVFENYIGDVPFYNSPDFICELKTIISKHNIDAIYPAMDSVAKTLKTYEATLACIIIGSDENVTDICASKLKTYQFLNEVVPCPLCANQLEKVNTYPVFIKPNEGYGSRNVCLAHDRTSAETFISTQDENTHFVFCEYLPGDEYTIDCFTDRNNNLLFHGARKRARVSNGISVNTIASDKHKVCFQTVANKINKKLKPRGAWFFQMKENQAGEPVLLEVAARLGGSSAYFRAKGINFAMLSAFDAFGTPVSVHTNNYDVELDRAFSCRFKLDINYSNIYIDFDDCLIINNKVNSELVTFLYQALNEEKILILITRHANDISESLEKYRLRHIFDQIIHIKNGKPKSDYIEENIAAIFIDDSFIERLDVSQKHGIPVFSPDMIESLIA